jgi:alkylated DNA repair protein (DNA oxidative demethylase)
MTDLFDPESFAPGAWLLPGFALGVADALIAGIPDIVEQAPWRRPLTPGGKPFSVEMTNCGRQGWVSDDKGYRYQDHDPLTGKRWAPLPDSWSMLARSAAARAGYADFDPDACLINRYAPGSAMGLHQDRDERDLAQPIVSVSLGLSATFLFGGAARADPTLRLPLSHGDVVVWGGPTRLHFHGIAKLGDGMDPATGRCRLNLTFRRSA